MIPLCTCGPDLTRNLRLVSDMWQNILLASFGLFNPLFYLCLCTKIGLLVLRDSDLYPDVHSWAKDTFGPCAAGIMAVIIHILTGQADDFGDDLADKLSEGDEREQESQRKQRLIIRRQITLFRTQSDFLATTVIFTIFVCERELKYYKYSRNLTDDQHIRRIVQFVIIGLSQLVGMCISQCLTKWKETRDRKKPGAGLPAGKTYHVFLSHKKEKAESEGLAVALKDQLTTRGFKSFFDRDNLDDISQDSLDRSIRESCCLLVVLDDVTLNSEWCRAAIKTAAAAGVTIRCLVDGDKYIAGDLCKQWYSSQYADVAALLFAKQIVEHKMAFRQHTLERLAGILDDTVDAIWQRELKAMSPQAGAMLEAVQQKENVFWLTVLYACFTITQCANWLSWFA